MSQVFLIDGYNLLYAMGVLLGPTAPGGLERARLRLQGILAGAFGDQAARVTVIYDASRAPPGVDPEQHYKGLHILFAVGDQEADDLIESLLAHHGAPRQLAVVSDDHRLQTAARRRRATAMSCGDFLDHLETLRRPRTQAETPSEECRPHPSSQETSRWLEEFAGLEDDPDIKEAFERFDFEDD